MADGGCNGNGYEWIWKGNRGVIVVMVAEVEAEVSITLYTQTLTTLTDRLFILVWRVAGGGHQQRVSVNLFTHAVPQRGVDSQATRTSIINLSSDLPDPGVWAGRTQCDSLCDTNYFFSLILIHLPATVCNHNSSNASYDWMVWTAWEREVMIEIYDVDAWLLCKIIWGVSFSH